MSQTHDGRPFQQRLQRLDALLQAAERLADPAARAQTQELVQAVLDIHAEGLRRILDLLAGAGAGGRIGRRGLCSGRRGGRAAHAPWASPAGPGDARAASTRPGPPLPPFARRQRRIAWRDRRGDRPVAAGGKLPRLPVVGRDDETDHRGGYLRQGPRRGRGGS